MSVAEPNEAAENPVQVFVHLFSWMVSVKKEKIVDDRQGI